MTLREQLTRDEGLRLRPYRDTTGHLTIGVGRNLDRGISVAEAGVLLDDDVADVTAALEKFSWYVALDDVRKWTITNMAFNLGVAGVLKFTVMVAAVKRSDWAAAADAMLASRWRKQVGRRAERLARQMREGRELL